MFEEYTFNVDDFERDRKSMIVINSIKKEENVVYDSITDVDETFSFTNKEYNAV